MADAAATPPIAVVAALIASADGTRVLVQQRRAHGALPLHWELPGGKVEPGESEAAALQRECREELGATVTVGARIFACEHRGAAHHVALTVYRAAWPSGVGAPACHAARQQAWVDRAELAALRFCPADGPLIAQLVSGELPLSDGPGYLSGSASTRCDSPR